MFKFIVLVALAALVAGSPSRPRLDGRIIGGVDSEIEDFPYQLSLIYDDRHICGASLLSERFAITAAHCTNGASAGNLLLRGGSSIRLEGGVVRQVKRIMQNPQYDAYYIDYDITILEVEEPFPLGPTIQPIGLPQLNEIQPEGTEVVVSGWGTVKEGSSFLAYKLQSAKVRMVSNRNCEQAYNGITDRMVCAGVPQGGKDGCQGDSGGPLVTNGKLVGVVSWGYGCARPGYPGVYSSPANMRDFIRESTGL